MVLSELEDHRMTFKHKYTFGSIMTPTMHVYPQEENGTILKNKMHHASVHFCSFIALSVIIWHLLRGRLCGARVLFSWFGLHNYIM